MQSVINRSLITLKKIAGLTTTSQIDTLNGDIDEFVPTYANVLRRWFLDNRTNGITLLKQKYLDLKELLELIIETQKHSEQLFAIKIAIEESTIGLTALKNNPRYQNDAIMRASLDFLLDNQIPTLINMAREDRPHRVGLDLKNPILALTALSAGARALRVKEIRERRAQAGERSPGDRASGEAVSDDVLGLDSSNPSNPILRGGKSSLT
jgi:hypothetical protein